MKNITRGVGVLLFAYASMARAETPPPQLPLSPELNAMLTEAIAGKDAAEIDTVAKFIKKIAPQSVATVDANLAAYRASLAEEEAAKAEAAKQANSGLLKGWKGEGQAGAYTSSGNSSTSGVALGIGLTKEGDRWRHNLRARADYQKSNGVTSRSQWLVAYEPNYKINDRLYAYGLAQYEKDRFSGYTSRQTLSGGLGYRVIANDTMSLDIKGGPAWRKTKFVNGTSTSRLNGLAGARFAWKISPTLTFTEDADALFGSGNTSLMSLTALTAKLGGAFSARVSYQVNHESNPPVGIKKTDTLSRLTLVYGF